jgi:hypothetical protein
MASKIAWKIGNIENQNKYTHIPVQFTRERERDGIIGNKRLRNMLLKEA